MNLAKFLRKSFLQNTPERLLLFLAFQKQPPEVFYKKGVLENFSKFTGKHLWFEKFSRTTFFYRAALDDCFWLFHATFPKWGTANSVWTALDEYSVSRNTDLRNTVQIYHFFLGSLNFQCMFSLVYTVCCQKQPPEKRCSVKKWCS